MAKRFWRKAKSTTSHVDCEEDRFFWKGWCWFCVHCYLLRQEAPTCVIVGPMQPKAQFFNSGASILACTGLRPIFSSFYSCRWSLAFSSFSSFYISYNFLPPIAGFVDCYRLCTNMWELNVALEVQRGSFCVIWGIWGAVMPLQALFYTLFCSNRSGNVVYSFLSS